VHKTMSYPVSAISLARAGFVVFPQILPRMVSSLDGTCVGLQPTFPANGMGRGGPNTVWEFRLCMFRAE
jgi:hypothetical protein